MKSRIFLVCLVLVLILSQAMLRSVETNYLTAAPSDTAAPKAGMLFSGATVLKPRCAQRRG